MNLNTIKDKLTQETNVVKRAIRTRVLTYIAGGLGLVAGLAWNDAIRSLIDFIFPDLGNTVTAKLIYAAILTLAVTIILVYVEKFMRGVSDQDKK
ncbi:MAG: DUF5654 family protein [bacterium]|nr:DUF5654 family protein [bacterium]